MKKIFNLLLALPLLMLAACAEDKALAPAEERTYTLNAQVAAMDSRLGYEEEGGRMKCHWELADTVSVREASADGQTYKFAVTQVNADGSAVLTYHGYILNANTFSGTATYAPRDAAMAGVQTADGNTGHLKYGETMTATLTNQKLEGSNLVFSHPETSVYKIVFKAPAAITAGSTLTLSGAWTEVMTVTLNFAKAAGATTTAYLIHKGGAIAKGALMRISLTVAGHTYNYTHTSTKAKEFGTSRYWVEDISDKDMLEDGTTPIPTPVDLGLSVMWGSFNLGASSPETSGDRYGWGCPEPYGASLTAVTWSDYFSLLGSAGTKESDCGTALDPLKAYVGISVYPSFGNIAGTEWDAAHNKFGGKWRMPTEAEMEELLTKCTKTWTTDYEGTGVAGMILTRNGNSIFLPAVRCIDKSGIYDDPDHPAGNYWFSTTPVGSTSSAEARDSELTEGPSGASFTFFDDKRYVGCVIRPVYDNNQPEEPEALDFGLPSGTKWANLNLGATTPEEYGDYYGWGCAQPYSKDFVSQNVNWNYYFQTYLGASGAGFSGAACGTDRDPLKDYVNNGTSIVATGYDAARQKFGGTWRLPTKDDMMELRDNCNWQWTNDYNGVSGLNGYVVTKIGDASVSMFLPAAGYLSAHSVTTEGEYGYYWCGIPSSIASKGSCIFFNNPNYNYDAQYRDYGCMIRPVCD